MSKSMYIGVDTSVVKYRWIDITASNISTYFNITDGDYSFVRSGSTMTSNNAGVHSSTATTSLNPKSSIRGFSFDYSVSSESGYDLFYVTYGTASNLSSSYLIDEVSGTVTNSYVRESSMSTSRYLTFNYKKDSSASSGNDKVVISNFKIRELVGTEVEPIARKVTYMYIGINNLARRVKKAYIGVNGIARIFYALPLFENIYVDYYGESFGLSNSYLHTTSSQNSNYVFYGSGGGAYKIDTSLTASAATALYGASESAGGGSTGNYAYFMHGVDSSAAASNKYTRYDTAGTRSYGTMSKYVYSFWGSNGNTSGQLDNTYAIYAGGNDDDMEVNNVIEYFNTSGTRSSTTMTYSCSGAAVGNNGTYAYIAGGGNNSGTYYSTVNTLNKSGTRSTASSLNAGVTLCCGAKAGNLCIISGGQNASYTEGVSSYTGVMAYNTSNTKTILTPLSTGRTGHSGIEICGMAVFAGAINNDDSIMWTPDIYDSSGTKLTGYLKSATPYEMPRLGTLSNKYLLFYAQDCRMDSGWNDIFDSVMQCNP